MLFTLVDPLRDHSSTSTDEDGYNDLGDVIRVRYLRVRYRTGRPRIICCAINGVPAPNPEEKAQVGCCEKVTLVDQQRQASRNSD